MPMPEFQQIVNEAKREIEEVDVPTLKKMQQSKEDFDLMMSARLTSISAEQFPGRSTSHGVFWSVTSIR